MKKNKSIFKKKSRRLDEESYNFYTYDEKLIYRYLCGKHIRRKELSKIPELHKFHKYHEWYDYIEKKYGNSIFVYIQCFKAFKMLNGSGTFGS